MENYLLYGVTILLTIISFYNDRKKTRIALKKAWKAFGNILPEFLGIIILVGIVLAFLNPEVVSKIIGKQSGWPGVLVSAIFGAITLVILAIVLGSAAAGPLYGAFPVAAVLMKKGAKFSNIMVFIGAWSTTKIPMFLFEISALGAKFAVTRMLVDIPGIILIGYFLNKIVSEKEKEQLYEVVKELAT